MLDHNLVANVLKGNGRGCKRIERLDITIYGEDMTTWMDGFLIANAREKAERIRHFSELGRTIGTFNRFRDQLDFFRNFR